MRDRAGDAAAVADQHGVGREHGDEALQVALAGGGEEAGGERAALARVGVEARALVVDPAPRTR